MLTKIWTKLQVISILYQKQCRRDCQVTRCFSRSLSLHFEAEIDVKCVSEFICGEILYRALLTKNCTENWKLKILKGKCWLKHPNHSWLSDARQMLPYCLKSSVALYLDWCSFDIYSNGDHVGLLQIIKYFEQILYATDATGARQAMLNAQEYLESTHTTNTHEPPSVSSIQFE